MIKVLWLSRHQMTQDQIDSLVKFVQEAEGVRLEEDVEIVTKNVTFPAKSDEAVSEIADLCCSDCYTIATGVFPAHIAAVLARRSAWFDRDAGKIQWDGIGPGFHVATPVSVPVYAEDGQPRGFQHSHWEWITMHN